MVRVAPRTRARPSARGELDINTRTRNALLRSQRYQGERGFALMEQHWRALQHGQPGHDRQPRENSARPHAIAARQLHRETPVVPPFSGGLHCGRKTRTHDF
jgi:hypothetical protein